jgi:hypothetical protein
MKQQWHHPSSYFKTHVTPFNTDFSQWPAYVANELLNHWMFHDISVYCMGSPYDFAHFCGISPISSSKQLEAPGCSTCKSSMLQTWSKQQTGECKAGQPTGFTLWNLPYTMFGHGTEWHICFSEFRRVFVQSSLSWESICLLSPIWLPCQYLSHLAWKFAVWRSFCVEQNQEAPYT